MKTIWKFPFETKDVVELHLPGPVEVLGIIVQGGSPCLYAIVTPGWPLKTLKLRIYGTGHPLDVGASQRYIATYTEGPFVWHVFQEI